MNEYYFLFILALVWIGFAVVQDMRKREVANWLTFSLIIFALVYRGFYAIVYDGLSFFIYGFIGFLVFFILAYAFYYGRVFAGGDAKLLMGIGAVLPFESYSSLLFTSLFFLFLLFFLGAIWTLGYSIFIVSRNFIGFKKEFNRLFLEYKNYYLALNFLSLITLILLGLSNTVVSLVVSILLIPLIYLYLKALENSCMTKLVLPASLTEGDWLERDVRAGGKWIRKSIHGLSWNEIKLIRKSGKRVWIKEGVPFTPAFLFAFLIMGLFFFFLQFDPLQWLLSLF